MFDHDASGHDASGPDPEGSTPEGSTPEGSTPDPRGWPFAPATAETQAPYRTRIPVPAPTDGTSHEPTGAPVPDRDAFDAVTWRAGLHADLDRWLDAAAATNDTDAEDPADDGGAALADAIVALDRLQRAIDGAATTVLPAFDASMHWAADAHRSPISWLVSHTGRRRTDASSWRHTANHTTNLPHTAHAASQGRLTRDHLRLLAHARRTPVQHLFDRDEPALVQAACTLTADALAHHLNRWHHDALTEAHRNEPDGPEPPHSEGNRLRLHDLLHGRGHLEADLDPATYTAIKTSLQRELDRLRRNGSLDHDPRTLTEIQGDTFADTFTRGTNHPNQRPPTPLINALIDLDTLLHRAHPHDDPTTRTARRAELLGHGPITDTTVRELLTTANISLLIVHPTTSQPLWYGRSRRLATQAQRNAALATHHGHCAFPACNEPGHRCDIDHLTAWTQHGETNIDNLAPLCPFHNRLKHRWNLTATRQPNGTITYTHPNGQPLTPPPYQHHPPPQPPDTT